MLLLKMLLLGPSKCPLFTLDSNVAVEIAMQIAQVK